MNNQQYSNHKKFYTPHHFIFLPLMLFLIVFGIRNMYTDPVNKTGWLILSVLSFCILYLAIMLRQHYALGNQDRIVRLEFRVRYFEMLGTSSSEVEDQLSFAQIAALRFANDIEFKILLQRALHEKLGADEIKKAIKEWKADTMRL